MTSTLDLNKMGLSPLSEFEMQEIEGGNLWKWLGDNITAVVSAVVGAFAIYKITEANT